jgi:TfoX/Sxy family transcriptional regulator of competence genes
MKYYIEEETLPLKTAFDEIILQLPDVTTRKMMGCPCYMANGKMFALLVTGGIVLTKLNEEEKQSLAELYEWRPFEAHRTIKKWAYLKAESSDLENLLPFIKASYRNALKEAVE